MVNEKIKEEENEPGLELDELERPGDNVSNDNDNEPITDADDNDNVSVTNESVTNELNDNVSDTNKSDTNKSDTKPEASGDTLTPSEGTETEEVADEPSKTEESEKMLTQSQVNVLVGKARQEGREAAMKELLERYGVSDDVELNDVFGRGQAYNNLNDDYTNQGAEYKNAMTENALLKAKVVDNRWDDIKSILGGKGLDVTIENIESMIPSHPEWRAEVAQEGTKSLTPEMAEEMAKHVGEGNMAKVEPPTTLRKLGNETSVEHHESDEEKARRLFGM